MWASHTKISLISLSFLPSSSGCVVDGHRFHGKGKDRRLAKTRAAEAALTQLFEMDFTNHHVDAIPYIPIVTDDQQVRSGIAVTSFL